MTTPTQARRLSLTADMVVAFVANNTIAADQLPGLVRSVHAALDALDGVAPPEIPAQPTLTVAEVRRSIRPDGLVSFEDGRTYKSLRRHLGARGLTMEAYREKWRLPDDYPAVSPAYSAARSEIAKSLGFGRRKTGAKGAARTGRKSA